MNIISEEFSSQNRGFSRFSKVGYEIKSKGEILMANANDNLRDNSQDIRSG